MDKDYFILCRNDFLINSWCGRPTVARLYVLILSSAEVKKNNKIYLLQSVSLSQETALSDCIV